MGNRAKIQSHIDSHTAFVHTAVRGRNRSWSPSMRSKTSITSLTGFLPCLMIQSMKTKTLAQFIVANTATFKENKIQCGWLGSPILFIIYRKDLLYYIKDMGHPVHPKCPAETYSRNTRTCEDENTEF